MRKYKYVLEADKMRMEFIGYAMNFAQMLARIESERNLDVWQVVEIREMKR